MYYLVLSHDFAVSGQRDSSAVGVRLVGLTKKMLELVRHCLISWG
jgi:hypothetical protein